MKYVKPLFHTTLVLVFFACLIAGHKHFTGIPTPKTGFSNSDFWHSKTTYFISLEKKNTTKIFMFLDQWISQGDFCLLAKL